MYVEKNKNQNLYDDKLLTAAMILTGAIFFVFGYMGMNDMIPFFDYRQNIMSLLVPTSLCMFFVSGIRIIHHYEK